MQYNDLKSDYPDNSLQRNQLARSPFDQFRIWYEEAIVEGINEPNAMALATASNLGIPSCRMVLMKHFDVDGLLFFTNYQSRKAIEIEATKKVACCFYWKELERQVLIEGKVEKATLEESQNYFESRPRGSRLGAMASKQDSKLNSRQELIDEYEKLDKLFTDQEIPLPNDWGGFRIIPDRFEFWQGRRDRLHDRFCYAPKEEEEWDLSRLSP